MRCDSASSQPGASVIGSISPDSSIAGIVTALTEDLFFDRESGVVDRLSRWVRARDAGESAAVAVLRELRAEVEAVSPRGGLMDGHVPFIRVIHGSPSLQSRVLTLRREIVLLLTQVLREETGAAPDDVMPSLMAGQINWVYDAARPSSGRR